MKKSMLAITIEHKLWFNWKSSSTYPSHCIFMCHAICIKRVICSIFIGAFSVPVQEEEKRIFHKIWIIKTVGWKLCIMRQKLHFAPNGDALEAVSVSMDLLKASQNVISTYECKFYAALASSTWGCTKHGAWIFSDVLTSLVFAAATMESIISYETFTKPIKCFRKTFTKFTNCSIFMEILKEEKMYVHEHPVRNFHRKWTVNKIICDIFNLLPGFPFFCRCLFAVEH